MTSKMVDLPPPATAAISAAAVPAQGVIHMRPSPFPPPLAQAEAQQNEGPISRRPWWIWAIGIVDIFAVIFSAGILVHDMCLKQFHGPDMYFWWFFLGSVLAVIKLLMAIALLIGLRHSDENSTIWYSYMWLYFQYFFLLQSFVYLIFELISPSWMDRIAFWPKWTNSFILAYLLEVVTFTYRVVTFMIVRRFVEQMESNERLSRGEGPSTS